MPPKSKAKPKSKPKPATQSRMLNPEMDASFGGRPALDASLADVDNRRTISNMMAGGGGIDAAPSAKSQAAAAKHWSDTNSGYWVLFVYNEQFVNRYMVPGVQFLRFFRARSTAPAHIAAANEEAKRYVAAIAEHPSVREVPIIAAANVPFLIPFSERTARDPAHVSTKLARTLQRHADIVAFRREDFRLSKAGNGGGGAMEDSEFHIWRNYYLNVTRTFDVTDTKGVVEDAVPASHALRRATARCRQAYDRLRTKYGAAALQASAAPVQPPPAAHAAAGGGSAVPCLDDDDEYESVAGSAAAAASGVTRAVQSLDDSSDDEYSASAPPAAAASAAAAAVSVVAAPAASTPSNAAPEPVLQNAPQKWMTAGRVLDALPETLRSPDGKFALAVFLADWDLPADTPEYADAAGMEWVCVPFGGEYETEDAAQEAVVDQLNAFVRDEPVSGVQMYKNMFPTEVNEDAIKTKHRTDNSAAETELNKVMTSRVKQMKDVRRAEQYNSASDRVVIPEIFVNDTTVPDIDDTDVTGAPATIVSVTQLTREEARLRGDVAGDPVQAAFTRMAEDRAAAEAAAASEQQAAAAEKETADGDDLEEL